MRLTAAALTLACAAPLAAQELVVETRVSAESGLYLTDADGRTLYRFSTEDAGAGCTEACVNAYRPVLVDDLPPVRGAAQKALLGTVARPDGRRQLTYDGSPLYRYVGDEGQGATSAAGMSVFGGTWHLVAPTDRPAEPPSQAALFAEMELQSPECVRYDAEHDRYLVSNINGGMLDTDDNGFISLVSGSGIAKQKWIEGGTGAFTLHAPKGMEIAGGELHVADINHLRVFDLETGAHVRSVRIENAKFLNDLAIGENGDVYITDTGTDPASGAIFRIAADGSVTKLAGGAPLKRPNGIGFGPDGNLVVVTYGADEVMLISREGEILGRRQLDQGQLDGLVVADDETTLVSSWIGHHIALVDEDGGTETLVTGLTQPACFEFLSDERVLLVPQVKLDQVAVVELPRP